MAAYGQAETCGAVAAVGSKVTGRGGESESLLGWDVTELPVTRKTGQKALEAVTAP